MTNKNKFYPRWCGTAKAPECSFYSIGHRSGGLLFLKVKHYEQKRNRRNHRRQSN